MTVAELLAETGRRGLQLRRKGDEIVVRGDRVRVDAGYLQAMRRHKGALLPVLRTEQQQPWLTRQEIAPVMLSLIALTQAELDTLLAQIPNGAPNVQDIYPLAPTQEGLLFHHLMDPAADPYILSKIWAFRDREKLEQCLSILQDIVNRHDILRTAIFWEGLPEPVQVVLRRATIAVETLVVPGGDDPVTELSRLADAPEHRLDLHQAPLLRAFITHDVARDRWLLLLQEHHLIGDHTSFDVLAEEVQAHLSGRQAQLPPPHPFRNFVAQARLGISQQDHEIFFRAMLGEVEEPTAPFGLLQVYGDGSNIHEHVAEISGELSNTLRRLAREIGVSLASFCHLAWALVLARTANRRDVVFGTVLFGRMNSGEGADRVMGPFINSLPIRIDVDDTSVLDGARKTHALLTELLVHEHASLAKAQRCSAVPAGTPLFSSLFNYRHAPSESRRPEVGFDGIEWLGSRERSSYAFDMSVDDPGDCLRLVAQVDARIDAQLVCRMMAMALEGLARALVDAPDTSLVGIDLLPAEARRQLLEWNDTGADYPSDRCVHELFEDQVAVQPDATALILGEQELSYAELDARANHLAGQLIAQGVMPEDRIAICMERSIEMVVGLLATLKAGAAYLPLNPADPAERLSFTLDDAAPKLLLTQMTLAGRFAEASLPRLIVDGDTVGGQGTSTTDSRPAPLPPTPDNAVSVLYTSGSTGRPKGVVIEHRNLVNRITLMRARFGLNAADVVLHKTPLTVDVSAWEIFAPLSIGAKIVLARPDGERDATYLAEIVARAGVTMIDFVPAMLAPFLTMLGAETELRHIFCGGDTLPPALLGLFRDKCPNAALHNMYGPTEATVDVTAWSCPADPMPLDSLANVPIGRPLPNTRIYILDAQGQPVPVGVTGELHIGGVGVARGYLNRPDLTAERFLADPFADDPDARLYRTGDLGRWRPDGLIEFLGRNDFQVKIRGFRIELGEIEARLAGHPAIREAVVLAREDQPGDKRLVAYVVPRPGATVEAETLRGHLAATLPDHMVPAAYLTLDTLPLTPNGKLDRAALPAPGLAAFATADFEPPLGDTETLLAAIWQDLLGLDRVGRHDNFLNLGGNSLLAITLIERLRQQGLQADIRSLFNTPSLASLAQTLATTTHFQIPPNNIPSDCTRIAPEMLPLVTLSQSQIDGLVRQVPGGAANVQDIYPLAPLQEGILFHYLLGGQADPYLSSALMQFRDRLALDGCLQALQRVVDRHDILRTAIFWEGLPEPVQVVLRRATIAVETLVVPGADDPVTDLFRLAEAPEHRLDLHQAPLLRTFIAHDVAQDRWLLLLQEHHLIGDHTSFDVLAEEVQAHLSGRQALLPPPQPFRNFVAQARLGISQQDHERFFRAMLGEVDEPTAPFGLLQVYGDGSNIHEHVADISGELSNTLRRLAREIGVSLASFCHLAWALVLARTANRRDVVFGTVLFGRMNSGEGADRVMGPFINSLPIRIDVDGTGVLDGARKTHALLTELLVHEHASLAKAQRCSAVPAGTPLFSSLFNYRHVHVEESESADRAAMPEIDWIQSSERTNYPVGLSVDDLGDGLQLVAQVDARIDARRVCRMMARALEGLARALAEAPDTPVTAIDILPPEERAQLVTGWNATAAAYPAERCVHELFEEQVAHQPDATALVLGGQTLSYAELDARANRLAHHLVAQGVVPDDRVALGVERSLEMVIALLAILKAGAAYVPLDPAYPDDRLAHMLADSAPRLVLTHAPARDTLARALAIAQVAAPIPLLDLVADAPLWHDRPDTAPDPRARGLAPANLAYLIYTSGSTGTPKGVMVEHKGLTNLAIAQIETFALRPGNHCLQFASMSFDASISEIFTTLCAGAALHLLPPEEMADTARLQRRLAEHAISHVTLPSAVLAAFSAEIPLPALATLVVAGDVLAPALASRWRHGRRLINAYGPTEATVCATMHLCQDEHDSHVPIGAPIANTRIYILDAQGQPVPVGVTGELHIGGVGVARGYLNRPDLTAERFLADPFADDPDARLYRTGDLGRWRPDGLIEFLGRNDFQVKIRGFRIELGEIEARLTGHPAVREAVVLAREDQPGDKRLVAYVVPRPGATVEAETLRGHLAATLPDHMVPAAYLALDALPLTPNGKLDRAALPAPGLAAFATADFEPPLGDTETLLAAIWQDLLGLDRVGRHDNFFNLGGNSLLAVSMISHAQSRFDANVDLAELFHKPTLAEVAEMIVISQLEQFPSDELASALDLFNRP